jgi:D-inositol-3-phosphate glycosyltransferase
VVHSHYWLSGWVGSRAKEIWGAPLVASFHTLGRVKNGALGEGDRPEPPARLDGEENVIRGADRILAPTPVEAGHLVDLYGADPKRIRIVRPGVDRGVFVPRSREDAKSRLHLSNDRLLLFVGRLDVVHKGLDVLLDAVAQALGWHVALVGSDFRDGRSWLLGRAEALRMVPRLTVTGPRHGRLLHEAFAAADCFALTSRWEGLPIALLEALAHGVPAVVSPAVNRLVGVSDAGAGWMAEAPELGALLRRLELLDSREWDRRAHAARALAARYDWAAVAARYEAAYARVISPAREDHHSDAG